MPKFIKNISYFLNIAIQNPNEIIMHASNPCSGPNIFFFKQSIQSPPIKDAFKFLPRRTLRFLLRWEVDMFANLYEIRPSNH